MNIQKILDSLKLNRRQVYIGEGMFDFFDFDLNTPISNMEISDFENNYKCIIPNDYKEFLLITNGMNFNVAGELTLYSIGEIIQLKKDIAFKKGIYPIGYILEEYIVINSNDITSGNYIYAGDCFSKDEYYSLDTNFKTFLDRYSVSNACNYWKWINPIEKFEFIEG